MRRSLVEAEHDDFRAMVRTWAGKTVAPCHAPWAEADGIVPRDVRISGGAGSGRGRTLAEVGLEAQDTARSLGL